ncbi:GNAT superfamily N-acetyltransferase [Rhodoligotrophos appendicifer]|uniref:GNAT family N-acetyltransferase n=1 Tax=Rhodoligotrophos appendicifer TaxID=987056 RepID=UPI001185CF15|nr:GNAT family N-acetyltransferase [Rhodoligotrophos appendicifer]
MSLTVTALTGNDVAAAIPLIARLRIEVFRDWPYLYDGDLDYEARYLADFARSPDATVIAAFDGERLVGASTAVPLAHEPEAFRSPVEEAGIDVSRVCYFGESILKAEYRGRGIGHHFFDGREGHARRLGLPMTLFCAVIRPADHPLKPANYRPLDDFWRKRGYEPVPGLIAQLAWRDCGSDGETEKALQFWMRETGA